MSDRHLLDPFSSLSTPLIADASMRLGLPLLAAPPGVRPVISGVRLAGRVLPTRHYGSVDVFLEAIGSAQPGDVLVADNGGRTDEAAVGDLTALEARAFGLAGMIVWGFHRDTAELVRIGFPVFSYGVCPYGPRRLDPREVEALESARFGDVVVTRDHVVFADDDGVIFARGEHAADLLRVAREIGETERHQADSVLAGTTLNDQLRMKEFLDKRASDPGYSLREHLRAVGAAIET